MTRRKKEQVMLHILADALLIAARMEPMRPTDYRTRPEPDADKKAARRWFSLMGIKL
jgi:hypothetical protein